MQQTPCTQKEPKHSSTAHCCLANISNFIQPWHFVSKCFVGTIQCTCIEYTDVSWWRTCKRQTRGHVPMEAPRAPPTAAPVAILFTHCWSSNATATISVNMSIALNTNMGIWMHMRIYTHWYSSNFPLQTEWTNSTKIQPIGGGDSSWDTRE